MLDVNRLLSTPSRWYSTYYNNPQGETVNMTPKHKLLKGVGVSGEDVVEYTTHDNRTKQAIFTPATFAAAMFELGRAQAEVAAANDTIGKMYADRAELRNRMDAALAGNQTYLDQSNQIRTLQMDLDAVRGTLTNVRDAFAQSEERITHLSTQRAKAADRIQALERESKDKTVQIETLSKRLGAVPVDSMRYMVTARPSGGASSPETKKHQDAIWDYLTLYHNAKPTADMMRGTLHAIGRQKFGDKWDSVRHALTLVISGGNTDSTTMLDDDEYAQLLDAVREAS